LKNLHISVSPPGVIQCSY